MNRVADVRLERLRLPLARTVRFEAASTSKRDVTLVRLRTDDGVEGVGELGSPNGTTVSGPTAAALAEGLRGVPVDEPDRLDDRLAAALGEGPDARWLRAALETAALDAAARAAGRPAVELLGGAARDVAVNGLLTLGPDRDALGAAARALVGAGCRAIKVKRAIDGGRPEPGAAGDVAAGLRAIRDAVGPDVRLRLDLNGDLTEDGAVGWLAGLAWAGLEYVEQPIPPRLGPESLARVRRAVPMPIAADEAVTDPDAAAALLGAGACDVLVVKPARVGGPRRAHRIVRAAVAAGLGVTISTFYESGIGLAAALHVAAGVPGDGAHGLGTADLLADDLVGGAMRPVAGRLRPAGPGLGVELDPAALARYRLS